MPLRIMFDPLAEDKRPRSSSAKFTESWNEDKVEADFLQDVVARWRRQK